MMLAMEKEYQLVLQSIANKPAKTQIHVNFTPIGMVGHAIATWNVAEEVVIKDLDTYQICILW